MLGASSICSHTPALPFGRRRLCVRPCACRIRLISTLKAIRPVPDSRGVLPMSRPARSHTDTTCICTQHISWQYDCRPSRKATVQAPRSGRGLLEQPAPQCKSTLGPGYPSASFRDWARLTETVAHHQAYISGSAFTVLEGSRTILQTVYDDDVDHGLEAIAIDEASGKIATCTAVQARVYRPLGVGDGNLKVPTPLPPPSILSSQLTCG